MVEHQVIYSTEIKTIVAYGYYKSLLLNHLTLDVTILLTLLASDPPPFTARMGSYLPLPMVSPSLLGSN